MGNAPCVGIGAPPKKSFFKQYSLCVPRGICTTIAIQVKQWVLLILSIKKAAISAALNKLFAQHRLLNGLKRFFDSFHCALAFWYALCQPGCQQRQRQCSVYPRI